MNRRRTAGALLLGLSAALAAAKGRAETPPGPSAFVLGQRAVFAVNYASTGDADFTPLLAGRGQSDQSPSMVSYRLAAGITGQMDVTIVGVSAQGVEEWCVFRAPVVRVVINGQPQAAQASRLTSQLVRGFLVDLAPDGAVARVRMGSDADASSQAFLRAFLALGQVAPPPASAGVSWDLREEDPNGPYTARYRIEPDPSRPAAWLLHKRILGYLAPPSAPELPGETPMRQVVTPDLDLTAQLDKAGFGVSALQAVETSDTAIEGVHVAHSKSLLRLTRTALTSLTPTQLAAVRMRAGVLAANAFSSALFQSRSPQEVETRIERSELGADTLPDLLPRLAAVDAAGAGADKAETDALYLKVKALAYLHPETAAPLGDLLAIDSVASPRFPLLAGALGAVGSPEAQAALARAIRARPSDWPALSALVPELCNLPAPTEDADAAVRALISSSDANVSAMAWLCLGGMAKGLAGTAADRSQAIIAQLTEALAESTDENAKGLLLQALGNANSAIAMPAVAPYATSASPVLRAAAMDAMRTIALPQVDPILRRALVADADPRVRLEAAFALGFRNPEAELFAAEKAAMAAEQDTQVRTALLNDLAKLAGVFPEARTLIKASADNDPSDDVRKAAAGLLQSLAAPSAPP